LCVTITSTRLKNYQMKAFHRIGFLIFLVFTVGFLKHNQRVADQLEVDAGEEIVLELPTDVEGMLGPKMSQEETISVDFPDEDVRAILRNVADLFDLNVIIPDSLQGRTSIKLRNVTWRQVFEVVLMAQGYTYVEDRNIIEIVSIEELVREPVDTRVFLVNYSTAADVREALLPLIDPKAGGRIQADIRSNALIITERPSRMNRIHEVIERLDRVTNQVVVEVKLFEVIRNEREPRGVSAEKQSGQPASIDGIVRREGAPYSPEAFDQILGKLEGSKDVRLASSFNITTLDDEPARIARVEKFPVQNDVLNESSGVNGFKNQDTEVAFTVHPEVKNTGFICLSITTEISHCIGTVLLGEGDGGMPLPMITSRSTSSKVMVKDGYTVSIGGMSEVIHQSIVSSAPVDLTEGSKVAMDQAEATKQFVMFVTAKTLNPDGADYRDSTDERVLHEMDIVDSDIPGYQATDEQSKLLNEIRELRNDAARIQATLEYKAALSDQLKQENETVDTVD